VQHCRSGGFAVLGLTVQFDDWIICADFHGQSRRAACNFSAVRRIRYSGQVLATAPSPTAGESGNKFSASDTEHSGMTDLDIGYRVATTNFSMREPTLQSADPQQKHYKACPVRRLRHFRWPFLAINSP
jgi:hypothetical protein